MTSFGHCTLPSDLPVSAELPFGSPTPRLLHVGLTQVAESLTSGGSIQRTKAVENRDDQGIYAHSSRGAAGSRVVGNELRGRTIGSVLNGDKKITLVTMATPRRST